MSIFEQFTKGQMDAQEMLNRNFAAVEAQLANKANVGGLIENPPLQNGWEYSQVFASQKSFLYRLDNIVIGEISVINPADVSMYKNIMVIPAGFRPRNKTFLTATIHSTQTDYLFAAYPVGELQTDIPVPANTRIVLSICWLNS